MQKNLQLNPVRTHLIISIILVFYFLIGMGIDLIAPSLPAIASKLMVSDGFSRNLISVYFLGYALGNFFVGILSDVYGRKNFFICGSCLFVLASFLPVVFPKAGILLLARFLQGLTIGCSNIASRGILIDVLSKERLLRTMSLTTIMWGLGPIIGPVIGGYLQFYFDWQACFIFFGLFGLIIVFAVILIIPETHYNRHPLKLNQIKENFKEILSHRVFIGAIIAMGFIYSLLIVFNTLGPFLIQVTLARSPIYFGHLALILGVIFLFGTMSYRLLLQKEILPEKIISVSLPISLIIAFLNLIPACFEGRMIAFIVIPTACMFFTAGLVYPALLGKGMSLFRHLAGNAGAVMSLVNILLVSFVSFAMGRVDAKSMLPLAYIYLLLMSLASLSYYIFMRKLSNL